MRERREEERGELVTALHCACSLYSLACSQELHRSQLLVTEFALGGWSVAFGDVTEVVWFILMIVGLGLGFFLR